MDRRLKQGQSAGSPAKLRCPRAVDPSSSDQPLASRAIYDAFGTRLRPDYPIRIATVQSTECLKYSVSCLSLAHMSSWWNRGLACGGKLTA